MLTTQSLQANPQIANSPDALADIQALDRYLESVPSLPPAPLVATQLLSLFSDEERDVDRIVELIGLDPSLTAEVLKRSNSAYMGLAQPVRDMFEAVFQLGFYEVYCIVVALVGSRSVSMLENDKVLRTDILWEHSVTTAVAAAQLAKSLQIAEAIAFTAGLLHDIGKLIFASAEGVAYADLLREAADAGITAASAEAGRFGFHHADLGARLLESWNLPENVCLAVRQHHSFSNGEATPQSLSAIVCLAKDLAHRVSDKTGNEPALSDVTTEALTFLGLKATDVPKLVSQTREGLEQVETLLKMRS